MFVRAPNRYVAHARMNYGVVLRAQVHEEALGLNPIENGEEEDVSQLKKPFGVERRKKGKKPGYLLKSRV